MISKYQMYDQYSWCTSEISQTFLYKNLYKIKNTTKFSRQENSFS